MAVTVEQMNEMASPGSYPKVLGFEMVEVEPGRLRSRFDVETHHIAANGTIFGGALISLADFTCGWGTLLNLPEAAQQFFTLEIKTNFIGTARGGQVVCESILAHAGRSTQVWDAEIKDGLTNKTVALFRCTQMLVYDFESKVGTVAFK